MGLQPEPLGVTADVLTRVDDADSAGAKRLRHQTGVQGHAGAEDRTAIDPGEDQKFAVRLLKQSRVWSNVAVTVADVVGDAGCRRGLEAGWKPDQHRVGVRDRELIGYGSAPVPTADSEAVHGDGRDREAVARMALATRRAHAAADLKGHHHPVSGPHPHHALAHREDLGHALVPEVEGQRKGGFAERHEAIEIAGGDRERVHDRAFGTWRRGHGCVAPLDASPRANGQGAHPLSGWTASLVEVVRRSGAQPPQPESGVALERRLRDGRGERAQQAQPVRDRSARAKPAHCPTAPRARRARLIA